MSFGEWPNTMNTNEYQARLAYDTINAKANTNTVVQSLTGIFGFPFTIGADVAVIPLIYTPLCNNLRHHYGHPEIPSGAVKTLIHQILPEIFRDLVFDKILGSVPIVGVYFNAICAKAFTWRLGTLFAMLSSRGPDIPKESVCEAMILIRGCFPQGDMYKFITPDQPTFMSIVTSVSQVSESVFQRKVQSAMAALHN